MMLSLWQFKKRRVLDWDHTAEDLLAWPPWVDFTGTSFTQQGCGSEFQIIELQNINSLHYWLKNVAVCLISINSSNLNDISDLLDIWHEYSFHGLDSPRIHFTITKRLKRMPWIKSRTLASTIYIIMYLIDLLKQESFVNILYEVGILRFIKVKLITYMRCDEEVLKSDI